MATATHRVRHRERGTPRVTLAYQWAGKWLSWPDRALLGGDILEAKPLKKDATASTMKTPLYFKK